jgi:uncharacterized membrane protein YedE/YeeE
VKLLLTAFVSGVVFAVGLGLGGMTQPAKVIGFLDFAGNWDPSLAFVMIGAITIHAALYRMIHNRSSPPFSSTPSVPARVDIDPRLMGGAAIFGLGWGIGGFCPGPALTSLASGSASVLTFVVAMVAGMSLYKLTEVLRLRQADATTGGAASRPATLAPRPSKAPTTTDTRA